MIQKTLGLASAVVVFASSPMLPQQKKQADEPKSGQQSRAVPYQLPLEIKGDRLGENLEDFKKHYPQSKCERRSETVTECHQNTQVSLAGEQTTDSYCDSDMRDTRSIQSCLSQGVHAQFEADKLKTLQYLFPMVGPDQVCESFTKKYGKPNEVTKFEGRSSCWWWDGEVFLHVSHIRPLSKEYDDLYVTILLSNSNPSKDI